MPSRLLIATLIVLALAAALPATAPAASQRSAARTVLALSDQRLSLMRDVMASKWASRTPVEDTAQEQTVLTTAAASAQDRGLLRGGVVAVFEQEIAAAKTVQLGWGAEWLLHGFPADEPAPDLTAIRAQLAALSPQIADGLAGLGRLRCAPGARADLLSDARRLIRTQYVTPEVRAGLVDAMLVVRRPGSRC